MAGFLAAQEDGRLPGSAAQTRAAWAQPPGPEVVASVRRHLAAIAAGRGNWGRWSPAERAEYVRLVFRPYVADEGLVQELAGSAQDAEPLYGLFCQQGAPRTGKKSSSSEAL